MNDSAERWLPIPGYEGHYDVSDLGRVRSWFGLAPGTHILKAWAKGTEHPRVALWLDGQRFDHRVHSLVMLAFVGPRPAELETRHLDSNHLNNRLDNLAYGTHSENEQDKVRNGTHHNARKTHCPQKHEYTAANTYVWHNRRSCRTCTRVYRAAYLARLATT